MRDLLLGRRAARARPRRRGRRRRRRRAPRRRGRRPRPLRDRARARRRLRLSTSCAPAPRRYAAPGRAARRAARHARRGPAPPRRDRQRHGAAASTATLAAVDGALEDLRAGVLRVLHDASFVDDPTRLWRVARYAARLGFDGRATARARWPRAADPATVSGDRLGAELRLALDEPDPLAALQAVARAQPRLPARGLRPATRAALAAALALLPARRAARDLLTLAACTAGMDARALLAWLDDMGFVARRPRPGGRRLALLHGRAAARGAHQRRDRPRRARRAGRGGRARGRRERAPLDRRPAPRAAWRSTATTCSPPASRRARRSARGCSARWTASSTARSPGASRSWRRRSRRTADRLAAR